MDLAKVLSESQHVFFYTLLLWELLYTYKMCQFLVLGS